MVKYFKIRILPRSEKKKNISETEQCADFFLKLLARNLGMTENIKLFSFCFN